MHPMHYLPRLPIVAGDHRWGAVLDQTKRLQHGARALQPVSARAARAPNSTSPANPASPKPAALAFPARSARPTTTSAAPKPTARASTSAAQAAPAPSTVASTSVYTAAARHVLRVRRAPVGARPGLRG